MGKRKELAGCVFGELTVLYATDKRTASGVIYWHCKCECGNDYITGVGYLFKGNVTSCGCIKSRGEYRINNFLREHNIIFSPQYVFNDCRNPLTNHTLPFDFYLSTYNCCIEYDGIQHFKEVPEWSKSHSLEAQQYRDSIKNQYCKKHNINLLRIPYTDFNNIENILISKLQLE